MVELVVLQSISYMAGALGVCVAAIYYVMTLRVQQRNMKINQETRQIQLLLDYGESTEETYRSIKLHMAVRNAQWTDYQDYRRQSLDESNREINAYRSIKFQTFHINGLMVRDGLIDIGKFVEYNGDPVIEIWRKYKDVILKTRKAYHLPTWLVGMEYLAEETDRYRIKMGWGAKTPDDFSHEYLDSDDQIASDLGAHN